MRMIGIIDFISLFLVEVLFSWFFSWWLRFLHSKKILDEYIIVFFSLFFLFSMLLFVAINNKSNLSNFLLNKYFNFMGIFRSIKYFLFLFFISQNFFYFSTFSIISFNTVIFIQKLIIISIFLVPLIIWDLKQHSSLHLWLHV